MWEFASTGYMSFVDLDEAEMTVCLSTYYAWEVLPEYWIPGLLLPATLSLCKCNKRLVFELGTKSTWFEWVLVSSKGPSGLL